MKQISLSKLFNWELLVVCVVLLGAAVQSCSDEQDDILSSKKELEIEDLKNRFGVGIEFDDIKSVSVSEIEDVLLKIKKEFETPIQLKLIQNDDILVFSSEEANNIVRLKSGSETASTSHNNINFKVTLSGNNNITYVVTSSVHNISSVSTRSSTINASSFEFKINVVLSMGGAYLHIPYTITGSFSPGNITCSVVQC
jgi:hypothetical protein